MGLIVEDDVIHSHSIVSVLMNLYKCSNGMMIENRLSRNVQVDQAKLLISLVFAAADR